MKELTDEELSTALAVRLIEEPDLGRKIMDKIQALIDERNKLRKEFNVLNGHHQYTNKRIRELVGRSHIGIDEAVDLLKTRMAAARTIQRGEDQLDAQRLDYMIAHGCHMAGSRDGDYCWLMFAPDNEEEGYFRRQPGAFNSGREAIDAAIRALKG